MTFIALISFVCGYCVGFYLFDLMRLRSKSKKSEEEIIQFFLSYKNNNGIMTKALAKMNLNAEFYFGKDLSIESNFLEEAGKIF